MARRKPNWPEWWTWDIDCSNPHLAKRMIDRRFNEADLREMLENATGYRPDSDPLRWVIETSYAGQAWEIVVEPYPGGKLLVVVTAFAVG
jgi:hypothetical protein